MHRRDALKNLGLVMGVTAAGCSSRRDPVVPPVPRSASLPPVKVSEDRILRTLVGLRSTS